MATTLQINSTPSDLPHLMHILPHRRSKSGSQVDEILLTLDSHQSRGRFGTAWSEPLPGCVKLVQEQTSLNPKTSEMRQACGAVTHHIEISRSTTACPFSFNRSSRATMPTEQLGHHDAIA